MPPRQLRQDVPGADARRWDRQGPRRETWDAPDFDPATYLVAGERAPGRGGFVELVRRRPAGG